MIGLHDEVQQKIFHEVKEIFGDDTKRVATFRDLNEMKYLERVLKETLRIYPSVPNISRKMSEDAVIGEKTSANAFGAFFPSQCRKFSDLHELSRLSLGGYKIPKDAFVALQIYFIHRDER